MGTDYSGAWSPKELLTDKEKKDRKETDAKNELCWKRRQMNGQKEFCLARKGFNYCQQSLNKDSCSSPAITALQ